MSLFTFVGFFDDSIFSSMNPPGETLILLSVPKDSQVQNIACFH